MDEYGSRWPLWTYDEGQEDRAEWNLSTEMRKALVAWALEFDQHFTVLLGWDSRAVYRSHVQTGERLATQLQAHFGDSADIELIIMHHG
jgi:hypothetical protein